MAAGTEGGNGFGGAASVDYGAIKGRVPVKVVRAERADGADDAGVRVLENGGKAGDAGFGDGFKDHGGVGEAGLGAGAIGAVGDLDAVGRAGVEAGVGDFCSGEDAIDGVRKLRSAEVEDVGTGLGKQEESDADAGETEGGDDEDGEQDFLAASAASAGG